MVTVGKYYGDSIYYKYQSITEFSYFEKMENKHFFLLCLDPDI